MLSLDSVFSRSGDRVLLDAVSFSLAPGQFYGVIGHNGAGKSTLIRLLGGELLPSSGAVLLDGAAVLREVFGVDLHLLAHPDGKHRVAVV